MTNVKKSVRFLTVLALVFAMVLSIASVPASAAGAETWYKSNDYIKEEPFIIRGYNLTPVKTMGSSGVLHLLIACRKFMDLSSNPNPVLYKYEIRSTNGTVLQSESEVLVSNLLPFAFGAVINVTQGQQIQLYVSAYDTVTGVYRTVDIEYWHMLE